MLRLVFSRPAEYKTVDRDTYFSRRLNKGGVAQARQLGVAIRKALDSEADPVLLSSCAPEASVTSLYLAKAYKNHGFDKELHRECRSYLGSMDVPESQRMDDDYYGYHQGVGKYLADDIHDAICVTHQGNLKMLGRELLPPETEQGEEWQTFLQERGRAAILTFDADNWKSVGKAVSLEVLEV